MEVKKFLFGNNYYPFPDVDLKQLKSIEPNVTGLAAIKVTETGIVDYISMANKMAKEFISN